MDDPRDFKQRAARYRGDLERAEEEFRRKSAGLKWGDAFKSQLYERLVTPAYRRLHREVEGVEEYAKRHRVDLDDVEPDGDYYRIRPTVKQDREERRRKHRAAFAERHGLPAAVRGAAAIEAASASGEPYVIEGVAKLPVSEEAKVNAYKNYDTQYKDFAFNGEMDQLFAVMNLDILQGTGNGRRVGNKIYLEAFEFRFRLQNTKEKFEMQNTYSWAGYAPVLQTGRTVPAVEIPAGTTYCNYYDTDDNAALRLINAFSTSGGTVATLLAETGTIGATVDLSYAYTDTAITLQAAQTVVDQPGIPGAPSWTAPAMFSANGPEAGNMCPVRIMVLYDRYGSDEPYTLGVNASWFDIVAADTPDVVVADFSPVHGLYNIPALSRFVVLYDTVWEPNTTNTEMTAICPPKEICLETVYNASDAFGNASISSGALLLGIAGTEGVRLIPPSSKFYTVNGFFRVIYKDS